MLALFGRDRQNLSDISYIGMDMMTTAPVTVTVNQQQTRWSTCYCNSASLQGLYKSGAVLP